MRLVAKPAAFRLRQICGNSPRGIAADEDYISQCQAQGLYPMAYYPHNLHFLWFAATAEGRSKLAIEATRKAASRVDDETLKAITLLAVFRVVPYYALTRFGKWDEMLREPEPPAIRAYLSGMWHYAGGPAFLSKGQTDAAEQEFAKLKELLADKSLDQPLFSPNTGRMVLSIASEVLAGQIAGSKKNYDQTRERLGAVGLLQAFKAQGRTTTQRWSRRASRKRGPRLTLP